MSTGDDRLNRAWLGAVANGLIGEGHDGSGTRGTSPGPVPDAEAWTPGRQLPSGVLDAGLLCLMLPLELDWELETASHAPLTMETAFLPSRASRIGTLKERPGTQAADAWRWPEPVLVASTEQLDMRTTVSFGASSMSLDDDVSESPLTGRLGACTSLWACPGLGLVLVLERLVALHLLTAEAIEALGMDPLALLADPRARLADVFPSAQLPAMLASRTVDSLLVEATVATRGQRGFEFLLVAGAAKAPESRIVIGLNLTGDDAVQHVVLTADDAMAWASLDTDSATMGDAFRAWSFHQSMPHDYPLRERDVQALVQLAHARIASETVPAAPRDSSTAFPASDVWVPGLDWFTLVDDAPAELAFALSTIDRVGETNDDFHHTVSHQESGRRIPFVSMPHVNSEPCNAWARPILRADGRVLLLDFDAMSVYHDYRYAGLGGGWLLKCLPLVAYLGQQAQDFWAVEALVDTQLTEPADTSHALSTSAELTHLLLRQMRRRQLQITLTNESDFNEWGQAEQLRQVLADCLLLGKDDRVIPRPEASKESYDEPLQIMERSVATQVQLSQQELALQQQSLALEQQRLTSQQQKLEAEAAEDARQRQERLREVTTVASVALGGATFIGLSAALAAIPGEGTGTLLQPVLRALFITLVATFVLGAIALLIWTATRKTPPETGIKRNAVIAVGVILLVVSFALAILGALTGTRTWQLLLASLGFAVLGLATIMWAWEPKPQETPQEPQAADGAG